MISLTASQFSTILEEVLKYTPLGMFLLGAVGVIVTIVKSHSSRKSFEKYQSTLTEILEKINEAPIVRVK